MSARTLLPPYLTTLQICVLDLLYPGELSGHTLRGAMGRLGLGASKVAFYQLMNRLHAGGLIAWKKIPGKVKQTRYHLTERGRNTLRQATDFLRGLLS